MSEVEDTLSKKTTSDFIIEMMNDEKDGETFTREYLKSRFLSSAVRALYQARRKAGLTQAQIAELLNTKQSAIARIEADTIGSISLSRYVEFALACGLTPLDISLEPITSVRNYVIHNPEAPRTQELYNAWLQKTSEPVQLAQPGWEQILTHLNAVKSVLANAVTVTNIVSWATVPWVNAGSPVVFQMKRDLGVTGLNLTTSGQPSGVSPYWSSGNVIIGSSLQKATSEQLVVDQVISLVGEQKVAA